MTKGKQLKQTYVLCFIQPRDIAQNSVLKKKKKNKKKWKKSFSHQFWISLCMIPFIMFYLCFKINVNQYFGFVSKMGFYVCVVWCVHRHGTSCFKSNSRRLLVGNVQFYKRSNIIVKSQFCKYMYFYSYFILF